jgi:hypothetical protein
MKAWAIVAVAAVAGLGAAGLACGPCADGGREIDLPTPAGIYGEVEGSDVLTDDRIAISNDDVVLTYTGDDGLEYRAVYTVESSEFVAPP